MKCFSMAYSLSNSCTKNYWNRTITVKIIVGGWVAYFFDTQCKLLYTLHTVIYDQRSTWISN